MRIPYDFHIHSALSPCADRAMTPVNIVAAAAAIGLKAIALTDHNAIANVPPAVAVGEALGVTVVPGIELQTAEDIHILALFPSFGELEAFYKAAEFPFIPNHPEIFGEQLIFNDDDEVIGEEERFLLASCTWGVYEAVPQILAYGGAAVAAHIDKEANGIVSILGAVPADIAFSALEFSCRATPESKEAYAAYRRLTDSDAHQPADIGRAGRYLEYPNEPLTAAGIVRLLREGQCPDSKTIVK